MVRTGCADQQLCNAALRSRWVCGPLGASCRGPTLHSRASPDQLWPPQTCSRCGEPHRPLPGAWLPPPLRWQPGIQPASQHQHQHPASLGSGPVLACSTGFTHINTFFHHHSYCYFNKFTYSVLLHFPLYCASCFVYFNIVQLLCLFFPFFSLYDSFYLIIHVLQISLIQCPAQFIFIFQSPQN